MTAHPALAAWTARLLGSAFLMWSAVGALAADTVMQLNDAHFRHPNSSTEQPVTLPDTWAQRGLAAGGVGHYRLKFELPAGVATVWALRIDRLSTAHELRLNGQLVHGTLEAPGGVMRPVPTLIPLPPQLLAAGTNTLDIAVSTNVQAGLSPVNIGPFADLTAQFQRSQYFAVTLPQVLNIASAGIAMFMLLLWWQRRTERVMGSFGALCLLMSLRNYGYFEETSAWLSPASAGTAYLLANWVSVLLFIEFAVAYSERNFSQYRRAQVALVLAFTAVTLWAVWSGNLQVARRILYPVLLTLDLAVMALVVQTAWRRRGSWDSALAIGLACVVAAAMHDYLYQIGRLSIMGGFWVPYAVPLIVAAYAALLLERLVLALSSTERMNITLEHRVLQRTRELQDANAAKARFLAAASHDLRQPMVSIGLLVGLLHEQLSSGPLQRVVQRLQEASAAMEQLLKRLLDLSRLQAGTVKVQRQAVPMQAFLTDVAARHVDHAQRKGLRLRVARTSAVVDADLVLLDQILSNLVGNAVRYTQSGGVLLGVRPAGASHWRVAVWDTGPGIPKSQHQAIFGEFVRGSQLFEAGDAQNGLGLGLAIVQRSAALMGTAAALRSQVGRGTCFSVMLPKARAQPLAMAEKTDTVHARPAAGIAEVREGAEAPLAGRRIWLLEDHGGARESMGMLLLHWGADLQVVDSLAAFQTALQNSAAAPDVVLSDHHLADGRGSTALLALRQRWPSARAVLVTGSTAPGELLELERWREAGVAVLLKPFASRELQAAVHQVLAAAPFRLPATGSSASEPQPAPPASGSRRPVCGKSRAGGS